MSDANLTAIAEHVVETTPNPMNVREQLDALEAELHKHEQVDVTVRHYFAEGLYAREITIPANVLAVGKIHKTQHINVISKGEVTMALPNGSALRVAAPYTWVVEPGKKAAAFAHAETVWTTFCINPTDETDVEKLEAALISPVYLDQLNVVDVLAIKEA